MALMNLHYHSDQLKKTVAVCLAVPDCNAAFNRPLSRYPVATLLHGLSHDGGDWICKSNAERYAAEREMVLVMPSADRSMYCDGVLGQNYFTYITEELPRYLNLLIGLSDRREQNFIMGFSMGGYGAARAALCFPEKYRAWGSLSGLLDLAPMAYHITPSMQEEFPFLVNRGPEAADGPMNPVCLPDAARHRDLPGYIACGLEDDLLPCTRRFEEVCREKGLPNRYVYAPDRRHDWTFWDEQLPAFLDFCLEV